MHQYHLGQVVKVHPIMNNSFGAAKATGTIEVAVGGLCRR